MSQGERFSPYEEDLTAENGVLSGFEFQDNIRKRVFWFTRAKLKVGRVPFSSRRMIEDLTRVIPSDFYGHSFESAKLSTRADFEAAFHNPYLLADLDAHKVSPEMRTAYSLLSHGYNSSALLGKIRNSEIKQAIYRIKLNSGAASVDTPFMDAWAKITDREPTMSVKQFIAVLRAERNLKHPENFDANTKPAKADPNLGYYTPTLENGVPLKTFTREFDSNDEKFEQVMRSISNKVGIEFAAMGDADGSSVSEKAIRFRPKRFFGALDVIKRRVSPLKNGISPTGWPKRYKIEYPADNTNTEKLYGVIKCLCGFQTDQLGNLAERVILANQAATNLPSPEVFSNSNALRVRGRLTSAATCLIASDVCYMLDLPVEQARLMSDTFRLEAEQHLSIVMDGLEDEKDAAHFMPLIANMYAIGVNNFAYDLNPDMQAYAEAKGISLDAIAAKMDGNPSMQGLIYANNVITDPSLRLEPDMNSAAIEQALMRIFEAGRQPTGEQTEEQSASPEGQEAGREMTPGGETVTPEPQHKDETVPAPAPEPKFTPEPTVPQGAGLTPEQMSRMQGVFDRITRVKKEEQSEQEGTSGEENGDTDNTDKTDTAGKPQRIIPSLEDLTRDDLPDTVGFEPGEEITDEEVERRRKERAARRAEAEESKQKPDAQQEQTGESPDTEVTPNPEPAPEPAAPNRSTQTGLRVGDEQTSGQNTETNGTPQDETSETTPTPETPNSTVVELTDEQQRVMADVFRRMDKSRGKIVDSANTQEQTGESPDTEVAPNPEPAPEPAAPNRSAQTGLRVGSEQGQTGEQEAESTVTPEQQAIFDAAKEHAQQNQNAGQQAPAGNINININNTYNNYFNTIIYYIIADSVRIFTQNGGHAYSAGTSQHNTNADRVVQMTLDRYGTGQSGGQQKSLDEFAQQAVAPAPSPALLGGVTGSTQETNASQENAEAKAQGLGTEQVVDTTSQTTQSTTQSTDTVIDKGATFGTNTESTVEVKTAIAKAKKEAPVLKQVDFVYDAARFESAEAISKRDTQAKTKCREILFELVMEYSSERMTQTAECAKMLEDCREEEKHVLEAERKYYKERASVGAVATVVMYPASHGRTQTNSSYNKQSFPEETQAVEQIDRLTGYIVNLVKEFCEVNKDKFGSEKISVTTSKLNKMLETSGATQLEGKSTRAAREEAGRALLKDSLRDTVYAILDGVTPPESESGEIRDLRQSALTGAAIDRAESMTIRKTQTATHETTRVTGQKVLDEYTAESTSSAQTEQEKF